MMFGEHATTYARSDLIVGCALWLVGLATVLLILHPRSEQYYSRRRPDRGRRENRAAASGPAHEPVWGADGGSASWN